MSEELKDLLGALAHNVKVGLGTVGKRAAASALKSGLKDGKKLVKAADKRLGKALSRLEEMIGPEEKENDDVE
jgi:hypothetical protein